MKALILALTLVSGSVAYAGGSVEFESHVKPILMQEPTLAKKVMSTVEFSELGTAVRIGSSVSPALGGTRVGPYVFEARERGRADSNLLVTIDTHVDFFDKNGKLVYQMDDGEEIGSIENMKQAVRYKESFSAVKIKLVKSAR